MNARIRNNRFHLLGRSALAALTLAGVLTVGACSPSGVLTFLSGCKNTTVTTGDTATDSSARGIYCVGRMDAARRPGHGANQGVVARLRHMVWNIPSRFPMHMVGLHAATGVGS